MNALKTDFEHGDTVKVTYDGDENDYWLGKYLCTETVNPGHPEASAFTAYRIRRIKGGDRGRAGGHVHVPVDSDYTTVTKYSLIDR